ncbi:MFS transporter [Feifania hominis]|uniref:MFS transporter n=1 Tax=Feifania hominis TaxID=2763660 RepID=A0A926HQ63_9FIRM|nr:MFS transporter [Feifania hominis]MBC8536012.1 MFS transporter [Feifania hominis]
MNHSKTIRALKPRSGFPAFVILWATQALSTLGSSMTGFALVIWSYRQQGSALTTALLSVCTYAPYVLIGFFAGALSDRWDKCRTLLVCDTLAALSTLSVFVLYRAGSLAVWHLYVLNAANGFMNAFQQPAGDVAVSLLAPREQYQRVGGMQSFSNSLVTILTPIFASAVLAFGGMETIIILDLSSFCVAFLALVLLIRIPAAPPAGAPKSVLREGLEGLIYLRRHRGVLDLILFLAAINLTASVFNAALPAMLLSRKGGGEMALGLVNTCTGLATVAGSVAVSLMPPPKSRVRVICNTLLFSMGIENILLAFGRELWIWCLAGVLGWLLIPVMNANMNALLRSYIPLDLQGRVFAARNTLQFFTIPLGYLLGGILVDRVFEPLLAAQTPGSVLQLLFGDSKGSGAAMLFAVLAVTGELTCLIFRRDRHIWALEKSK